MPKCLECGFEAPRLQWTHFRYKCSGRFKNCQEYRDAYPGAKLVDNDLAAKTAITLENLIKKHGEIEGIKRWDEYRLKQARSNSFEYKKEKYGWTKEQFNEYNKSRAITLENLTKKHGEIEGTKRWIAYCERQAYTNTREYFVEKYGKEIGTEKYKEICKSKSHSIESIMLRTGCSYNKAIEKYKERKQSSNQYSSGLELEIINKIEDTLGISLDYSAKTKQYCIYANNKVNFYDIVHNMKAIEINGDYWHCNPKLYEANYYHSHSDNLAKDIWEKDRLKIEALEKERGIKTMIIWESEYKADPDGTIKRCIEWLN